MEGLEEKYKNKLSLDLGLPSSPTPASTTTSATVLAGTNLLPVLLASYLDHNTNSTYLANAFYGSNPSDSTTWPQTLWDAIDRIGIRLFMRSIFRVSSRLQKLFVIVGAC